MGAVVVPCLCPGSPHDEDTIVLRDRLPFVEAQTARNSVILLRGDDPNASPAQVLAVMTEQYLLMGIESWSLVDDRGKALPVTKANIRGRVLEDWETASTVADAADELYAEAVLLPLLKAGPASSASTSTGRRTSVRNGTGRATRKPSSPSSISTIPTDGTATTSRRPAGGSSSSRNSKSAA